MEVLLRLKVRWIPEGEKTTKYFYSLEKKQKNHLTS